ncbi:MAG: type IV pilus assembly protein PilM, partial [Candidatus Entotheonellia bacterium]
MLKPVVGVDIGSSALKVVELQPTWKGFEIVKAVERRLPVEGEGSSSPERTAQALTELFSAHAMKPARLVSVVSAHSTFVRNLHLPFRDPRKIREVLKFELESHIPFPVEEVIVDFVKVRETEGGGCEVLTVAVPKAAVAEHLRIFDLAGLKPEILDWEVFGELNSYLAWRGPAAPGPVVLLNLGANKTTVKILQGDQIAFTRSIARGGNALTEAIRQHLSLSTNQAEALKLSTRGADRSQIAEVIESFLGGLAKEIEHTLLAFSTRAEESESPREIILLGGGARLPEALDFFRERFGVPTVVFDADQRLFPPSPLALHPQAAPAMAVATGAALRCLTRRAPGLDFRREEFALHKSYEEIRGKLIALGALLTCLVGLSLFNFYYQLQTEEARYSQFQRQVDSIFRDTFPDVRRLSNEIAQAREKVREIETNLKGVGTLHGPQGSSLEMLRELSVRVPSSLQVKMVDLTISPEGIGMSGET